jgi:hypothetical protein
MDIWGSATSKINNITITYSSNSLTFTGTVESVDTNVSGGSQIRIITAGNIVAPKKIYTCVCNYTSNINELEVTPYVVGAYTNLYRSSYNGKNKIQIYISGSSAREFVASIILKQEYVGQTISFSITDLALYEGAFCNPPMSKSLDVLNTPNIIYKERLYGNKYGSYPKRSTTNVKEWKRIYEVPVYNNNINPYIAFYGCIQVAKEYNNSSWSYTEVKFSCFYIWSSDYPSGIGQKLSCTLEPVIYTMPKAINTLTDTSITFSKYRLSLDKTNMRVYLDGYHNNTSSNDIYLELKDWYCFGKTKDWRLNRSLAVPTDESNINEYYRTAINNFCYGQAIPSTDVTMISADVTFKGTVYTMS